MANLSLTFPSGRGGGVSETAFYDLLTALVAVGQFADLNQGFPGEAPEKFTASLSGAPSAKPPFTEADRATVAEGAALRIAANTRAAPIQPVPVLPDTAQRVRFTLRRSTDPAEGVDEPVNLRVAWFDNAKVQLTGGNASTTFEVLTGFNVASGVIRREFGCGLTAGPGVTHLIPAAAKYGVAFVQTTGSVGVTDIVELNHTLVPMAVTKDPRFALVDRPVYATASAAEAALAPGAFGVVVNAGTPSETGLYQGQIGGGAIKKTADVIEAARVALGALSDRASALEALVGSDDAAGDLITRLAAIENADFAARDVELRNLIAAGEEPGTLYLTNDGVGRTVGGVMDLTTDKLADAPRSDGLQDHLHAYDFVLPDVGLIWPNGVTEVSSDGRAIALNVQGRAVPFLGAPTGRTDVVELTIGLGQSGTAGSDNGLLESYIPNTSPAVQAFSGLGGQGLGTASFYDLSDGTLTPLAPVAARSETWPQGFAQQWVRGHALDGAALPLTVVGNCGLGNASLGQLGVGGVPFANGRTMCAIVRQRFPGAHIRLTVVMNHGERDAEDGTSQATYETNLGGLMAAIDLHWNKGSLGNVEPPLFLLCPPAIIPLGATGAGAGAHVQNAMQALAAASANVAVAANVHQTTYTDSLHTDTQGALSMGAQWGWVAQRYRLTGTAPSAPVLSSATIVGSDIQVRFSEYVVQADTGWSDALDGFSLSRGGAELTLAGVAWDAGGYRLTPAVTPVSGDVVAVAQKVTRSGNGPGARTRAAGYRGHILRAFDSALLTFPATPSSVTVA